MTAATIVEGTMPKLMQHLTQTLKHDDLPILLFLFFHATSEEVEPILEISLVTDTHTLCVECGFREVTVVVLVICFQICVSIRGDAPFDVEVTNETGILLEWIIAIAEVSVDEQTVVEESS